MSTYSTPASGIAFRPGFPFHPLRAAVLWLAAWSERRRNKADFRLLMSLEPRELNDIDFRPDWLQRAGGLTLQFHPAVLATTMNAGMGDH